MTRTTILMLSLLTVLIAAPAASAQSAKKRLSDLMIEAYDHLEAGEKLVKAKKPGGTARLEQACDAYAKVLEGLETLKLDAKITKSAQQVCHYNTACARALQGKADPALKALKLALEAGYQDWNRIENDASLNGIRANPRFVQILERVQAKLATEARKIGGAELSKKALFPFDFKVTTLDGKPLSLADLKGKVVIVDYWGTWCPPCRMEIPHFVALKKQFKDKLAIVGMTWENGQSDAKTINKVNKFAAEAGINYRLVMLKEQTDLAAIPGGVTAFPTTLFIDKQGRVRAKEIGYRDLSALKSLVTALDAEKTPGTPAKTPEKTPAKKAPETTPAKKKSRFF